MTDPLDVAETVERPSVSIDRAKRLLRRRTLPPPPASTEEVAPEDILLETYPEPPRTKPMLPDLVTDEVDELLRATEPPPVPSVAPMAMAIAPSPIAAPPPLVVDAPPARSTSSRWLAAVALFLVGVAATAAVVLLVPVASFARAKATARALFDRAPSAPPPRNVVAVPAPPPPSPAPSSPAPAPAPSPSPAELDTAPVVPVDALPKPMVAADTTLVTLPAHAVGHRVYVDDVVLSNAASPAKIKCGKRTIRIGSQGKPRAIDLPCGRDYVLR